jgi:arsenate reductase
MITAFHQNPRSSWKPISNAFKTVRLTTSGSEPISRLLRRCELTADGLVKPSKTKLAAPASHESQQTSFQNPVSLDRQLCASYFREYLLKDRISSVKTTAPGESKSVPYPLALQILREDFRIDASDAYSKSWEEFKDAQFDFVITLCDNAKESCPVWPGQPIVAHWSSPDPAAVEGSNAEKRRAFWQVAQQIKRRLELLSSLPFEKLDALRLEAATKEIGLREKMQIGNQTPA